MNEHLGGPEPDDVLIERHHRYLRLWEQGSARMFVIVDDGSAVGGIGWWDITWRDAPMYETGWFVVPEAQGRGVAASALASTIDDVTRHGDGRPLAAFPATSNVPSNRLCERAGFQLRGTEVWPFRGTQLDVNAWILESRAADGPAAPAQFSSAAGDSAVESDSDAQTFGSFVNTCDSQIQ